MGAAFARPPVRPTVVGFQVEKIYVTALSRGLPERMPRGHECSRVALRSWTVTALGLITERATDREVWATCAEWSFVAAVRRLVDLLAASEKIDKLFAMMSSRSSGQSAPILCSTSESVFGDSFSPSLRPNETAKTEHRRSVGPRDESH